MRSSSLAVPGMGFSVKAKVTGILVNGIGYDTATATVNKQKVTLGVEVR